MRKVVQPSGLHGSSERRPILRAALETAGGDEQPLFDLRLELLPQLVCAPQQRHIGGVLVVGEPDDASQPVG